MNERYKAFANVKDPPVFTTKPKTEKPVEEAAIARIAEENNFPSREASKPKKAERRKPRTHSNRPQCAIQREGDGRNHQARLQPSR